MLRARALRDSGSAVAVAPMMPMAVAQPAGVGMQPVAMAVAQPAGGGMPMAMATATPGGAMPMAPAVAVAAPGGAAMPVASKLPHLERGARDAPMRNALQFRETTDVILKVR